MDFRIKSPKIFTSAWCGGSVNSRTISRVDATLTENETATAAVVRAVADAKDVGPLDLDPLNTVVDADALDRLVDSMAVDADDPIDLVQFAYSGCRVTVVGDGSIVVDELAD